MIAKPPLVTVVMTKPKERDGNTRYHVNKRVSKGIRIVMMTYLSDLFSPYLLNSLL